MPKQNDVFYIDGLFKEILIQNYTIQTYYVIITISYLLALIFLLFRTKKLKLDKIRALDLSIYLMISGFLGARFFYVLYEEPLYYWKNFLEIFEFWKGGFVFYGGSLLAILVGYLYLHLKLPGRKNDYLNLFAPVAALGYAIGRVACLATGCCYGSIGHLAGFSFRHPTQLYAVILEFITLCVLLKYEKRKTRKQNYPDIFILWLSLHSVGRIIMEYFRADPRGPSILGLSISSVLSLAILLGIVIHEMIANKAYLANKFIQKHN